MKKKPKYMGINKDGSVSRNRSPPIGKITAFINGVKYTFTNQIYDYQVYNSMGVRVI